MTVRTGTARTGFTLIELLVVLWALTVALGLGVALLLAAMRSNQVGAATLRDLSRRAELADQFRGDVARADAAPDRLGELAAGPTCLILRSPGGTHVVYRWEGGKMVRTVCVGDKESRRPFPVGTDDMTVEFTRPAGDRPVITLRLIEAPARGAKRQSEVSAALGGDTR